MMDSDDDDNFVVTYTKRGETKKMNLSKTAEKQIESAKETYTYKHQINEHLDPRNEASVSMAELRVQHNINQTDFKHYFLKNKHKNSRAEVFSVLRDMLLDRGYTEINKINDKLEESSIMVIRIIDKVEGSLNTFRIEDEQNSDEKMVVKQGIVWIGMICAVRMKYYDGMYRLMKSEDIIDLSEEVQNKTAQLMRNIAAHRIMIVKGPFRTKFRNKDKQLNQSQDKGIRLITTQIKNLRKRNIIINSLIVLGPILSKDNYAVKQFRLAKTFEEQYEEIIQKLRVELKQIPHKISLFIVPALEDVVSMYPIPQPSHIPLKNRQSQGLKFISNPSMVTLDRPLGLTLSLVNYDIIEYIHKMQGGKALGEIQSEQLTSYLKQPFYMTNTLNKDEPLDETNLGLLFNNGNCGDLVIMGSTIHAPSFRSIKTSDNNRSRGVVNIGSLGVDLHDTMGSYMTIISAFQGDGDILDRIKVDFVSMFM